MSQLSAPAHPPASPGAPAASEPVDAPAAAEAARPRRGKAVALAVLFALTVAFAAFAIAIDAERPGVTTAEGWYARYDQGRYLDMARQLVRGELPTGRYSYGLGYPALAVPVLWLGFEGDPFAPVDALALGAVAVLVALLGTRLRSLPFGLGAAVAVTVATPVLSLVVVPWNSTVTILAVLVALLVATHPGPLRAWHGVALGVAVGGAFASRYVDGAFPAVIGAVGLLARPGVPWRALVASAVTAAAIGATILWTHELAFGEGPFRTPYALHVGRVETGDADINDQELGAYDLGRVPRHALEVFVTGYEGEVRSTADPLVRQAPWLLAAPVGLAVLWRSPTTARATRLTWAAAVALSVAASTFYLSFRSGGGDNLKHDNLRYFVGWVPVWGLLALLGGAAAVDRVAARRRSAALPASRASAAATGAAERVGAGEGDRGPEPTQR